MRGLLSVATLNCNILSTIIIKFTLIMVLLFVIGHANISVAEQASITTVKREKQRQAFKKVEEKLRQGNRQLFKKLKQSLQDYPLYPYLEYWDIRKNLDKVSKTKVRKFLQTYKGSPVAEKLREKWLVRLAKKQQWKEYIRVYLPSKEAEKQCYYLQALIKTGRKAQAMKQVSWVWLVGESQPKACDSVFALWIKEGHLKSPLVWQRVRLAMGESETQLARYLKKFLAKDEQKWVDLWYQVHKKPQLTAQARRFKQAHPVREHILLDGIIRWARKDVAKAQKTWHNIQNRYGFNQQQKIQAEQAIAKKLIFKDKDLAIKTLSKLPKWAEDDYLRAWRIRLYLEQQDWKQVLYWLDKLPKAQKMKEVWRYWRARSLEQLGQTSQAKKLYAGLSLERSFYGFLAADKLGVDYQIIHRPMPISNQDVQAMEGNPGLQRAIEFYYLQRNAEARSEWYHAIKTMDAGQLLPAAKIAYDHQWYDRAIITLGKAGYWDDLETRFPTKFQQEIQSYAKKYKIDSAWAFAILRKESAFVEDARSSVGAMGLMQLMPATAKAMAKKAKIRWHKQDLLTAKTNIRLGTAYLQQVLKTFKHKALATASYNAGAYRVKQWLPDKAMPADIWIEIIPFTETRRYVKSVLEYMVVYQYRLKQPIVRLETHLTVIKK